NARFDLAVCALELEESDAENQFLRYIKDYPASANSKAAYFQVGRSYFAKKDYAQALEWFDKLDSRNLAGRENREFRYKKGYSYFMTDDYASAKPLFETLKDEGGVYQEASIDYYAYLCYLDREFKTALAEFEDLKGSRTYEATYPYYTTAVYYLANRYADVLAYALPSLENTKQAHEADMFRIIAATYFAKNDFEKAQAYYDKFQAADKGKTQNNQDSYQIGYIAYKNEDYET